MENLMLYFHIPFCVSKCRYCAFYSIPNAKNALKDEYTNALISQIKGFKSIRDPSDGKCRTGLFYPDGFQKKRVSSVYFGGGTPTVLGCNALIKVLKAVLETFSLDEDAEITLEANPGTVSAAELAALRRAGFNRLSIGAQSFNGKTLKSLGRIHTSADFVKTFKAAGWAGFSNISADLMFALPGEALEDFKRSLDALLNTLSPPHISAYGLTLEQGTPLYDHREDYSFPSEDEEEKQYETLCAALAEAGYEHYEVSNFAREGFRARHNTGYWRLCPYFGFGAGAHSFFLGRRFSTPPDINAYIKDVKKGPLAPTGFQNAPETGEKEAEEERIMLGLRLSDGVDLGDFAPPEYLFKQGLIVKKDEKICLTEKGFRVSNRVIGLIIDSL